MSVKLCGNVRTRPDLFMHDTYDMIYDFGSVATGAWVKSENMYLIRGSVGAYALFLPIRRRNLPIRRRIKKKKNRFCLDIPLCFVACIMVAMWLKLP